MSVAGAGSNRRPWGYESVLLIVHWFTSSDITLTFITTCRRYWTNWICTDWHALTVIFIESRDHSVTKFLGPSKRRCARFAFAQCPFRLGNAHLLESPCWDPSSRKEMNLGGRITIEPQICHDKPTIRGLRYTVAIILELLSSGMTVDEILADYENLEGEFILAALDYNGLPLIYHDFEGEECYWFTLARNPGSADGTALATFCAKWSFY